MLAHRAIVNGKKITESLSDHLHYTAIYTRAQGAALGISYMCLLLGLLHDGGKASYLWQEYIDGKRSEGGDHATVGGWYIQHILYEQVKQNISPIDAAKYQRYNEFLIYPILAHHGMFDIIHKAEGVERYWIRERLEKIDKAILLQPELKEFFSVLNQWAIEWFQESLCEIYCKGYEEWICWQKKLKTLAGKSSEKGRNKKSAYYFYCGVTARLLMSVLKEGDMYDSTNGGLEDKQKQPMYRSEETADVWKKMTEKVEALYAGYHKGPMPVLLNRVRTAMADEVYHKAVSTPQGCFTLPLPVGAGKTMAALRYALRHSVLFSNRRILYITAFLSVLEQNAREIQNVIGVDHVLEHHSNVIEDRDRKYVLGTDEDTQDMGYDVTEYLKESWESPFILTTLVQLSNTLFKGQAVCLRRFSKLIRSIIIIDEIQSLPIKTIYLYNLMMNFLTHMMGVTIIHCTATLPSLHDDQVLQYPCLYGYDEHPDTTQLVSNALIENAVFSRVGFYSLMGEKFEDIIGTEELLQHVAYELKTEKSVLIIVNTRAAVKRIYDAMEEWLGDEGDCYYLTTNLCAAHRLNRIEEIKGQLKKNRNGTRTKPLICISTKLIEAGVNVDFDIVYRSVTALDSVVQSGGRCNREGEKDAKGKVYLFLYQGEHIDRVPTFLKERNAAKAALRSVYSNYDAAKQLDLQRCLPIYFSILYGDVTTKRELFYPVEKETIVDWLSDNADAVVRYNREVHPEFWNLEKKQQQKQRQANFMLRQNFKSAAKTFQLIDNTEKTVIVQYQNEELINELFIAAEQQDYQHMKLILKKLQRYTVTLYNLKEYEMYIQRLLDWDIYILDTTGYNEQVGLLKGEMNELIY